MRRILFFFFQAEDGIRDYKVTGVQTWLFRSVSDQKVELKLVLDQSVMDRLEELKGFLAHKTPGATHAELLSQIGRASCRERLHNPIGLAALDRRTQADEKHVATGAAEIVDVR